MTVKIFSVNRLVQVTKLAAITSLFALSGQFTVVKAAPAAASTAPVFASIDMSKIIAGYSKRQSDDAAFQQTQQLYSDTFKTQSAHAMLGIQDQAKLGQLLLLGGSATDDQKTAIQALEDQSSKASDSLSALQQKQDATDADKIELQQLTQQQQDGQGALQQIADQYRQTLDQQNQKMSADIAADIRVAVGQVAKAEGISLVFDNSVAIYTPLDLTPAVIAKLASSK